ncbi:type II toxin-antitoxin system YhaV family toxin [Phyllobacterium sp. LjRoot231]|uniref:type II toxin-antitoxin system YhaV family toxin n=1 Tax=Phyllobacterium sp. LjRoot231 TaxID=3342289 RepID=UPI003ECFCD14
MNSNAKKIIIFAWVNDAETLKTRGSKTDAYQVFKDMVNSGNPPDDCVTLEKSASDRKTVG